VRKWHEAASIEHGGEVDLSGSSYLVLSWNTAGQYQLHRFALQLPDPEKLNWYFPIVKRKGREVRAKHLNGDDGVGRVFEWYGESSGGQLKYYPLAETALWASDRFRLEPLPGNLEHGILARVAEYFPHLWAEATKEL
jgi:hypothetical protein